MKNIIWIELLLIKLLLIVPLVIFTTEAQNESIKTLFSAYENIVDVDILNRQLEILKQIAKKDPTNIGTYRKQFIGVAESKNSLKDFISLKKIIVDDFSKQMLNILIAIILISILASVLISNRIAKRYRILIATKESVIEKDSQIKFLKEWQLISKKVVHEIKGPLTPIKLIATDITSKFELLDSKKFSTYLNSVADILTQQVSTLGQIISDFTTFGRLPEAQLERTYLDDFWKKIENDALAHCDKNIHIDVVKLHKKDLNNYLLLDQSLLSSVIINLIRNAIEANPEIDVKIKLEAEISGDSINVFVKNRGNLIPSDIEDKIWGLYFSTKKNTSGFSNMGLGLAIAKKIVFEHNGTIALHTNDKEHGVTFKLSIPIKQEQSNCH